MRYYRNRKQKFESELIRNCIKVCYKEVDIEAPSLRLQHRYDTIWYDVYSHTSGNYFSKDLKTVIKTSIGKGCPTKEEARNRSGPPVVSPLDLGVAEFLSTRRRKNKSRSPPEKYSSKSEIYFTSEVTPDFSKSNFYRTMLCRARLWDCMSSVRPSDCNV